MAVTNKDSDNGVTEFQFQRREERTKWQTFKNAIYDPTTKQILGRTSKNWGQLLLFYSIFYVILAALFAICIQGLFASLPDNEPKWKLDSSLIGTNPGLGFRPISNRTEEGSLISYNLTNQTTVQKWVTLMNVFLEPYTTPNTGKNVINCNFDKYPQDDEVCLTTTDQFKNCGPEHSYGYNSSSPCVFLKLNRIYGWQPEFFTNATDDMPLTLQNHINNLPEQERNQIWITCTGESDFDQENVKNFTYYPRQGFEGFYYPFKNQKFYLSPIIAVHIISPTPNVILKIECRAWAKNIIYRGGDRNRAGSVKFEIMIDTDSPLETSNNSPVKTSSSNNTTDSPTK